jgi:hypothetical protein
MWKKWSWSNFKVLTRDLPRGTEDNQKTPNDIRSPGRDLNSGPPEYEEVLTTQSRRSVALHIHIQLRAPVALSMVNEPPGHHSRSGYSDCEERNSYLNQKSYLSLRNARHYTD